MLQLCCSVAALGSKGWGGGGVSEWGRGEAEEGEWEGVSGKSENGRGTAQSEQRNCVRDGW